MSSPLVSKLGLGGFAMSNLYGHDRNDEERLATLHAAIDAGITLLDTSDFYSASMSVAESRYRSLQNE
jgi:aryl-alcohol dehydrogenase-like predicted oxidoreductase